MLSASSESRVLPWEEVGQWKKTVTFSSLSSTSLGPCFSGCPRVIASHSCRPWVLQPSYTLVNRLGKWISLQLLWVSVRSLTHSCSHFPVIFLFILDRVKYSRLVSFFCEIKIYFFFLERRSHAAQTGLGLLILLPPPLPKSKCWCWGCGPAWLSFLFLFYSLCFSAASPLFGHYFIVTPEITLRAFHMLASHPASELQPQLEALFIVFYRSGCFYAFIPFALFYEAGSHIFQTGLEFAS